MKPSKNCNFHCTSFFFKMGMFKYFALFFTILYGIDCQCVADRPFGKSIFAIEKFFFLNHKNVLYPKEFSCNKIYGVINPFHNEPDAVEDCNSYIVPAHMGYPISFTGFPKYNGLKVDLQGCTCKTTFTYQKPPCNDSFFLARLDGEQFFLFQLTEEGSFSNFQVYLYDYVEFISEERTYKQEEEEEEEIPNGKRVARVSMESKDVEESFINSNYDLVETGSGGVRWSEISHLNTCTRFYDSLKRNYNLKTKKNEDITSNCFTASMPTTRGYEIKFEYFPFQEPVTVDLAFCDCFTSISTSETSITRTLDATKFYLAKLVNNGINSYYYLVDNDDLRSLKVVSCFKIENESRVQNVVMEGVPTIIRPYTHLTEISRNFWKAYTKLYWGDEWQNKNYVETCEKVYSTIKYIDPELNTNVVARCGFEICPVESCYYAGFKDGLKFVDMVKCECWKSKITSEENTSKFGSTSFYLMKIENHENYYRLEEDSNEQMNAVDYVEFV